jgi:hypothetical protein
MPITPRSLHRRWGSTLTALVLAGLSPLATARTEYLFDVSYNDRPIGSHRFTVIREGEQEQVRSEADFEVKVLFMSVFRYRHVANERSASGCLTNLESETDDNGTPFAVGIESMGEALRVTQRQPKAEETTLPVACATTFSYWDLERLQRDALVNAQNGKLTPTRLTDLGATSLDGEEARHYRLEPAGMDPITLWYGDDDQRWLALETRRGDGVLRYRLQDSGVGR